MINELVEKNTLGKNDDIKILISCNTPCIIPSGEEFIRVEGGRALRTPDNVHAAWLDANTIGDDTGENISRKNRRYNELTVMYWAWKNYDKLGDPEYIGFMQYRRWFIFDKWKNGVNRVWTFSAAGLQEDIERFTKIHNLRKMLAETDLLYGLYKHDTSVRGQYLIAENHDIEDLNSALSIINCKYPEYREAALEYQNNFENIFCNMFVMRKSMFFEYCEWIFEILDVFDKQRNYKNISHEDARFFISERLTGIFIYKKLMEKVKAKPLAIAMLAHHEPFPSQYFSKNNIPVIFATDNNYFRILYTALISLIKNSTPKNNYDIFVLHSGIKGEYKNSLSHLSQNYNNISIRLINIINIIGKKQIEQFYDNPGLAHTSLATYYRFFIPRIFCNYEKVIYLDCDIIILDDIAKLYEIDLGEEWIGAVKDIRESIAIKKNFDVNGKLFGNYVQHELGLTDPYSYFQAGVLVYNIKQMNKNDVEQKLCRKAVNLLNPPLQDQDILNSVCFGHVKFLPSRWNIEWQIGFEFNDYKKVLNMVNYHKYEKAIKEPAIIHFASPAKPWNSFGHRFSEIWWEYAALTPFFRDLIYMDFNLKNTKIQFLERQCAYLEKRLNEPYLQPSLPRKIVRKIFPKKVKDFLKNLGLK